MTEPQEWVAPAIVAIKAAIDPRSGFTADDMAEASRLLTACCMAAGWSPENNYNDEIRANLESLKNGYGCWLETVETAIGEAAISDADRAAIKAAFGMASAWLLDMYRQKQQSPTS